jgi:NAD-dependent dihydropyrimidine dehydrogenase PreA subunit
MSKSIALFYFSGTGNTKWVCDEFAKQYSKIGKITLFNIDRYYNNSDTAILLTKTNDIVGFAYPVIGANIPKIMADFIDSLKSSIDEKKMGFILTTVGYINAYGPFMIQNKLKKININEHWHEVIPYFDNTKGIVNPDVHIIQEKASKQISTLIEKIKKGIKYYGGVGPFLLPGYLIRALTTNKVQGHYRKMNIDKEKCILCLKCIKNCPVEAIVLDDGIIKFNSRCTSCFRCIKGCDYKAINY